MQFFNCVLAFLVCLFAFATHQAFSAPDTNAQKFLEKFGYITKGVRSTEALKKAIMKFQEYAHIPQTGEIDKATLAKMAAPRCGMPDYDKERYVLYSRKWNPTNLTYGFNNYTPDLTQSEVEQIVADALQAWEDASSLTFTKVDISNNPVIKILFGAGSHGDSSPFDGAGSVLAHAYLPTTHPIGADSHFDEDETWTDQTYSGINLFQVAVHEFGHAIGLSHSANQDAIMYAYYRGYVPNFQLHSDDIAGIQALYGPGTLLCDTPRVNAAAISPDGEIVVFKGTEVYLFNSQNEVVSGFPMQISDVYQGVPNYVAAAVNYLGEFLIFKGTKYYKVTNDAVTNQGLITQKFPNGPEKVDAAFVGTDGKLYLIRDNSYYRFGTSFETSNLLSSWTGMPSKGYHAAVKYNDEIYVFKGLKYFKLDLATGKVSGYPKNTADDWFRCATDPSVIGVDPN